MSMRLLTLLTLAVAMSACNSAPSNAGDTATPTATKPATATPADRPAPPPSIGGDRDAHGCLVPAGYAWCEREHDCVRPWELAKTRGFENSASGFETWCNAKPDAAAQSPKP